MITLTFQPLRAYGRILLPVGKPQTIATDYLNSHRAVIEECGDRGWFVHKRSKELARSVSGDAPLAIACTVGGGALIGIWKGATA
jgi:hypothetical protein